MTTRLIDESLFDGEFGRGDGGGLDAGDPPRLVGARCSACGTVVFPRQDSCPRCPDGALSARVLPVSGRVWSWTLQAFPPKPPYRAPSGGHRAYHVGYVDLGEVLVEARLAVPRAEIRIGLPVRLTTVAAYQDEDGTEVLTFAFAPDRDGGR
ncbi:Zn-ribbon domain-containing OB-fold protein [Streptomyces collinus]|uniref:OB-fold protein n=1 Tax=Streptomyces collinus TaxID=42684 RepID=A0AA89TKI6_STRCU|nr:zinc ribbon domain-containing protein [Streptomyces collinus]MBB5815454.1 putative OB-fold protein [Streptomyces collinus]WMX68374.1 zinc ribbon domain-containing protein [Streptomyces collinus]